MPSPSLIFGFILATFYGSTFHFVLGGDARRLALFLLAGWLGFALGQMIGDILQIGIMKIGRLYFFTATAGAFMALAIVMVMTIQRSEEII